jgi:hypothetical protein
MTLAATSEKLDRSNVDALDEQVSVVRCLE